MTINLKSKAIKTQSFNSALKAREWAKIT